MPQYNFQLRGWQALLAIPLMIGIWAVPIYLRARPVDDSLRDAIRMELLKEYSGRGPKDMARLLDEAHQGSPVEPLQPLVQRDVEFTSIAAHGKIGGRVTLVKADVTVDGGPPPDGRSIRYFSVSTKLDGGWMVIGESNSYNYFWELWH